MVRAPHGSQKRFHAGTWQREHLISTQHVWQDGTMLINSSTSQLRLLQVRNQAALHGALAKWAIQLNRPVLADVWTDTWISYRSMAENTFLWQLIYRIPATNKWRFPDRAASDPDTWCVRCQQRCPEDLLHCMWACPNANRCWSWCAELLSWLSVTPRGGLQLSPAHILIAD